MNKLLAYLKQLGSPSEQTLSVLAANIRPDTLKKGEYFIAEGEYANEIAFLESGVVRAFYVNSEGKEYNKTLFTANAIIGSYAALISKEKNRLPQQALTDCKIWRMKFALIEQLSEDDVEVERLRRKIAERFFVWNEKKQLEMALLEAKERYGIFLQEHPGVEDLIPQYHIASYLGVSPTQLSRIRQNLDPNIE
ncbi:MAG: Crp/Fnr family transcriptional regulator [Pseudomonadales bacterium]